VQRFRQALRDLGYVEGQTIALEVRWAENHPERWPDLATDLVGLPVDIIVAGDPAAALAAQHATSTIPIVMAVSSDPVRDGLVASLARPGGNITGLSIMVPELAGKRLELLREAMPSLSRVALLLDAGSPNRHAQLHDHEAAARALGVQLLPLEVRGPGEFAGAFQAATQGHAQALIMVQGPLFGTHRARLAELALASRLPTMAGEVGYAKAGGLMDYGPNLPESWHRAATYVHKILNGANPADLPVEQPTKFELVLNLKTAQALGIRMPASLLLLADEVIQ
jgi:putative ABC transport system substrate-binding protein